jgi:hypothetical protein
MLCDHLFVTFRTMFMFEISPYCLAIHILSLACYNLLRCPNADRQCNMQAGVRGTSANTYMRIGNKFVSIKTNIQQRLYTILVEHQFHRTEVLYQAPQSSQNRILQALPKHTPPTLCRTVVNTVQTTRLLMPRRTGHMCRRTTMITRIRIQHRPGTNPP